MELRPGSWERGTAARGRLLFVTGFLVAPRAYASLLTPVAEAGFHVVVPTLAARPRLATGSVSPRVESKRAVALSRRLAADGTPLWIGGHSRGGLVAWIAAAALGGAELVPTGLVLVDPVSGGGPPWSPPEPPPPLDTTADTLIVGCANGGRCAPAGRNHEDFARAAPGCTHIVVPDCGHADMLDGIHRRLGAIPCRQGRDPARARTAISQLLVSFLRETVP